MSVWSGIAAAGVAIALALVAVGQPIWEWQLNDSQRLESWSYGPFSVHHTLYNKTTNRTDESRDYTYGELVASQPNMAKAFADFGTFFLLGLIATVAGLALSVLTALKKLRGIFAGLAFLAGCGSTLYATFSLVFTIPSAATKDLPSFGSGFPQFAGQYVSGSSILNWTPLAGWILFIVAGLAIAWASSDMWHIVPARTTKAEATKTPVASVAPIARAPKPAPSLGAAVKGPAEPVIEEVFLIGANGLLIKHMSRSLMSDKDRDVVGSMISAISSFVREAFSERDGEVHEVTLGDHRFVMCNESGVVVAVLVTSGDTEDIVHRMRHLLVILKDRYGARLSDWQGESIEGIEDELAVLWEPYHLPPPPMP